MKTDLLTGKVELDLPQVLLMQGILFSTLFYGQLDDGND